MDPDASVDSLAGAVFGIDLGNLSTRAATARITRTIVEWAMGRGWSPRREARFDVPGQTVDGERLGFVDVIVRRGGHGRDLAIEIDSAHKPWSVVKLQHAAANGMRAIWIRWGDETWAGVYDDIDVIQVPLNRRPEHRQPGGQVAVWDK